MGVSWQGPELYSAGPSRGRRRDPARMIQNFSLGTQTMPMPRTGEISSTSPQGTGSDMRPPYVRWENGTSEIKALRTWTS